MSVIKLKIVESDNVIIKGVGHVVGEVEYGLGHPGSFYDPPEPAEIGTCDLRLVGEGDISNLFDNEEAVAELEDAVGRLYASIEAEFERAQGDLDDPDFPF